MHILMKMKGSKIKTVTRIRQDFVVCGHLWSHKYCVSEPIPIFVNDESPVNENFLTLKLHDKPRITESSLLESFVSHKVILLRTLLLEMYVRRYIFVTNWKELNTDVNRICAEYCGSQMEEVKKRTESLYYSVTL